MGAASSSRAVVSEEEAARLLTPNEYQSFAGSFSRLRNGEPIDSKTFASHVVIPYFDVVPNIICDALFNAFDGNGKGLLTLEDFLKAIAVLKRGTREQRLLLAFHVYDIRRTGYIERKQLRRILDAVYHPWDNPEELSIILRDMYHDSQQPDAIDLNEFRSCVKKELRRGKSYLTEWLQIMTDRLTNGEPHASIIELHQKYDIDCITKKLGWKLRLSESVLLALQTKFQDLCNRGNFTWKIEEETWLHFVSPLLPKRLASAIFIGMAQDSSSYPQSIDDDPSDHLVVFGHCWTIAQFATLAAVAARGNTEEKLSMLFNVFDADKDGFLGQDDVINLLKSMASYSLFRDRQEALEDSLFSRYRREDSMDTSQEADADDDELFELFAIRLKNLLGDISCHDWTALVTILIAEARKESPSFVNDDKLTYAGFQSLFTKEQYIEMKQMVEDLVYLCAVHIGLRPSPPSVQMEMITRVTKDYRVRHPIIEESYFGQEGTCWYIISTRWWMIWSRHCKKDRIARDVSEKNRTPSVSHPRFVDPSLGRISLDANTSPATIPTVDIPPISNLHLVKESKQVYELVHGLTQDSDYQIIPPLAWKSLEAWFGGGPPIDRYVTCSRSLKACIVSHPIYLELYPLSLRLAFCDSKGKRRAQERQILYSKNKLISTLLEDICNAMKVDREKTQLWDYANLDDWRYQKVLPLDKTLGECGLLPNQLILIEVSLPDGTWPRAQLQSMYEDEEEESGSVPMEGDLDALGDGLKGLHNLGNTCYLNASIQCLSHSPLLTDYFLSGKYVSDINLTNTMGLQGRLAHFYGNLVRELWKAGRKTVTPRKFKDAIGKFNSAFLGNDQHDAQELLSYLLNGLSEDLNRIEDKPYLEQPDSDGRPDHELADIWWKNHLRREFSIIVALFAGQFRSLLTCQSCGYASARFEPFTILQLPLPEDQKRYIRVIVVPEAGDKRPIRCTVTVPKDASVRDLVEKLISDSTNTEIYSDSIRELRLSIDGMIIIDLQLFPICSIVSLDKKVALLQDSDVLHIYQLKTTVEMFEERIPSKEEESQAESDEDKTESLPTSPHMPTLSPRKTRRHRRFFVAIQRHLVKSIPYYRNPFRIHLFRMPLICHLPVGCITGAALYEMILEKVRRFYRYPVNGFRQAGDLESSREELMWTSTSITDRHVAGGELGRFGFRLRLVDNKATSCGRCHWLKGCVGCLIADNAAVTYEFRTGEVIAIDWHMSIVKEAYNSREVEAIEVDQSVDHYESIQRQPMTLEKCLDVYTEEETIPEAYCSKCKSFRRSVKKMEIWRLPPILVLQLKRFQYTTYSRRKLNNFVKFPVAGLDLTPYLADNDNQSGGFLEPEVAVDGDLKGNDVSEGDRVSNSKSMDLLVEDAMDSRSKGDEAKEETGTPGESGFLSRNTGRTEAGYDLYATIYHVGALSGGHYVASIKSQSTGKWHLFNDGQVQELRENDLESSSAYILFYVRRDIEELTIEDIYPSKGQMSSKLSLEELESLMNRRDSGRCEVM